MIRTTVRRLDLACDVSGSIKYLRHPVASTAWIIAHAAHRATVPVTTVIYGAHVGPITHPGTVPDLVTEEGSKVVRQKKALLQQVALRLGRRPGDRDPVHTKALVKAIIEMIDDLSPEA